MQIRSLRSLSVAVALLVVVAVTGCIQAGDPDVLTSKNVIPVLSREFRIPGWFTRVMNTDPTKVVYTNDPIFSHKRELDGCVARGLITLTPTTITTRGPLWPITQNTMKIAFTDEGRKYLFPPNQDISKKATIRECKIEIGEVLRVEELDLGGRDIAVARVRMHVIERTPFAGLRVDPAIGDKCKEGRVDEYCLARTTEGWRACD